MSNQKDGDRRLQEPEGQLVMTSSEVHFAWAIVILRLGAFISGLAAFCIASYMHWEYAGWILVPTVIAGLMCSSLGFKDDDECKEKKAE